MSQSERYLVFNIISLLLIQSFNFHIGIIVFDVSYYR